MSNFIIARETGASRDWLLMCKDCGSTATYSNEPTEPDYCPVCSTLIKKIKAGDYQAKIEQLDFYMVFFRNRSRPFFINKEELDG